MLKRVLLTLMMINGFNLLYSQSLYVDSLINICEIKTNAVKTKIEGRFKESPCFSQSFKTLSIWEFVISEKIHFNELETDEWVRKIEPEILKYKGYLFKRKAGLGVSYSFVDNQTYDLIAFRGTDGRGKQVFCNQSSKVLDIYQYFAHLIRDKKIDYTILVVRLPGMFVCIKGKESFAPVYDREKKIYELIPLKEYLLQLKEDNKLGSTSDFI